MITASTNNKSHCPPAHGVLYSTITGPAHDEKSAPTPRVSREKTMMQPCMPCIDVFVATCHAIFKPLVCRCRHMRLMRAGIYRMCMCICSEGATETPEAIPVALHNILISTASKDDFYCLYYTIRSELKFYTCQHEVLRYIIIVIIVNNARWIRPQVHRPPRGY